MSKPLVATGKAAEECGITHGTLLRWLHAGLVTPALVTAGGQFRWDTDDLRRQLAALSAARGNPEPQ